VEVQEHLAGALRNAMWWLHHAHGRLGWLVWARQQEHNMSRQRLITLYCCVPLSSLLPSETTEEVPLPDAPRCVNQNRFVAFPPPFWAPIPSNSVRSSSFVLLLRQIEKQPAACRSAAAAGEQNWKMLDIQESLCRQFPCKCSRLNRCSIDLPRRVPLALLLADEEPNRLLSSITRRRTAS
jgi:hypothetical protein